jgi:hypothetical protein
MLRILIVVLALADGILHFALNWILFRGNLFGPLGFPSPWPVAMNHLFVLNLVGYIVLAVAFLFGPRLLGSRRWVLDGVLIVYTLLSIAGWLQIGSPNPRGLGLIAKSLEVALIVALAAHAWSVARSGRAVRSNA